MIITLIFPSASCLAKGYQVEHRSYPDAHIKKASTDIFNRMHEGWADTGKVWLVHESNLDDCVLLQNWAHITGTNHNVVMEVEGETEC